MTTTEANKAIVRRWYDEFWHAGKRRALIRQSALPSSSMPARRHSSSRTTSLRNGTSHCVCVSFLRPRSVKTKHQMKIQHRSGEGKNADPIMAPIAQAAAHAKADPSWRNHELPTRHEPWETMPQALARLLHESAQPSTSAA